MAKRRKTNYFYSIISMALVLFLLGAFAIALLYAKQQTEILQDKILMKVEIKDGADSLALEQLKVSLPIESYVKAGSMQHITKEDAAKEMMKIFGSELINEEMPMAMQECYAVSLKPECMVKDSIEAISVRLKENLAVSDVYMDEGMAGELTESIKRLGYIALIMAIIFIIIALTLIHNTIRINLYSDRFIIKNMELVGASWGFISRPYRLRSVRFGLISGLIAVALLAALWFFIQKNVPEINLLLNSLVFWGSILALLLLGIVINWLSTYYVVNKYLKMRLDDLY
jgi:cell division transport system permease protein